MPRILTSAELAAIRERNEKRTQGEWTISDDGEWVWFSLGAIKLFTVKQLPNATFIAHNSEDVPAMLQTIGALRGMLEHIRDMAAKGMPDSVYVNVASGLARRVLERMDAQT